jgi:K+-transporting ATPase KdpF subunit
MYERFTFSRTYRPGSHVFHGIDSWPRRTPAEQTMNPLYLITGIVAIGLLVYLLLALVKPEWFG